MSTLSEIQQQAQRICTPLAFLTNATLIQLILHKSPKSLGVYKYLMLYIAVFEIFYAIVDVWTVPDFYSFDKILLVIVRTDKTNLPIWMLGIMDTIFCSFFGVSMAIFAIHFIYRYLVVSGNKFILKTTAVKMCVWLLTPFFYGVIWFAIITFQLNTNPDTDAILREHYIPERGISMANLTYRGPNYYFFDEKGNEKINWDVMFGMGAMMSIVGTSILAIIFFATLSYRCMGAIVETSSNSKQYRTLQIQLLNSLVCQALIPALLMHGPACFIFTAPFFHMGNMFPGGVIGVTISLYPVLDPLPTMFIIRHYRNALLKCCSKTPQQPKLVIPLAEIVGPSN